MTYEITVLRTAVKSVEKLPKEVQDRIVEAIAELAETPRPTGSKKLIAREALRIRVGDYRIIYEVDDESKTVQVVVVCHVHVRRQQGEAKYWMNPIERADSKGFRPHELGAIERILVDHKDEILAAWQKVQAEHGDRSSEN